MKTNNVYLSIDITNGRVIDASTFFPEDFMKQQYLVVRFALSIPEAGSRYFSLHNQQVIFDDRDKEAKDDEVQ